ncbi:MAG TPA: glycosyltransferase, partial [Thermoanaerobaculia bacterium]|nr:glycosyltransferase [Thermoanaerobaculia bacterium]
IVGDGPEGERLRRVAERLGDRVSWLGYRPWVAPYLAAADLFVLASRGDAYPTVLLEAAAAGLPVIATHGGGVPEIVADGESGLLVPPGDAGRLAAAIEELLSDPPRAAAMAAAARRRAASDFSAARWAERLAGLYRRLVADGGVGSGARPLRVAVVEPAARGGMIHYAYQLCRGLALAGADPILVTARGYELADLPHPFRRIELLRLWDPKPVAEDAAGAPAPWRRLVRGLVWYREWLRLVAWLVRERPDVVQLGDLRFAGDLLPLVLLRLSGLPLVDVCHNVEPFALGGRRAGRFGAGAPTRWLYRRIYHRFDRVVVHFAANRTAFLEATGLPPERTAVVAFGNQELFAELADPRMTPAVLRRRLALEEGRPVVLVFGTLAPYKGVDLAIEAFAEVCGSQPAACLVIAGYPLAGFDLAAHRRRADDRGIGRRVCFVPAYLPATEVATWMALAAVVLVPYHQAFQSGVLSLAQTFGRPLVATRVGAMAEAVENGRTGVLVPPDDPPAMAAAITALLADPEGAERLGQAAAAEARERSAWRLVAEDLLAVHREAIRSRGRGR